MNVQMITETLSKSGIAYALLDEEDNEIRILISEKNKEAFQKTALKAGWKKIKDKSKDLYLYGMKHFLYYTLNEGILVVCFQIACRSTLNNGWVPLDRKINGQAIDSLRKEEGICCLGFEDEICYLAAKCIYTKKHFDTNDIKRIEKCMPNADMEQLIPKLESVFFKFTGRMLQLIDRKKYGDIIGALWCYAQY